MQWAGIFIFALVLPICTSRLQQCSGAWTCQRISVVHQWDIRSFLFITKSSVYHNLCIWTLLWQNVIVISSGDSTGSPGRSGSAFAAYDYNIIHTVNVPEVRGQTLPRAGFSGSVLARTCERAEFIAARLLLKCIYKYIKVKAMWYVWNIYNRSVLTYMVKRYETHHCCHLSQ